MAAVLSGSISALGASVSAHEEGGDVKLHAGADEGHFGQLGRKHHDHITGAGDGQVQLDGVLTVTVEDGNMGALGQAQAVDESAAAGHSLA